MSPVAEKPVSDPALPTSTSFASGSVSAAARPSAPPPAVAPTESPERVASVSRDGSRASCGVRRIAAASVAAAILGVAAFRMTQGAPSSAASETPPPTATEQATAVSAVEQPGARASANALPVASPESPPNGSSTPALPPGQASTGSGRQRAASNTPDRGLGAGRSKALPGGKETGTEKVTPSNGGTPIYTSPGF
jgi:hypothetical protein